MSVRAAGVAGRARGHPWSRVALVAGESVARLSRGLGLGGGSIIGGRVSLVLDRRALQRTAEGRQIVLVSGTNGKTTTSHMLTKALRVAGAVAHNSSGSNMADGALAALMGDPDAAYAVIETDELHLAQVADAARPVGIVLLNLTRDQLDRVAEVRTVAARIAEALARHTDAFVVANADDPMTVWATRTARRPVWIAAGMRWRGEAVSCPSCGHTLRHEPAGDWWCDCGLRRPDPTWWLTDKYAVGPGVHTELTTALPGQVNRANALMALAAATQLDHPPGPAAAAIGSVTAVAGRYAVITYSSHTLRLILAKNPAGWAEALTMLAPARPLLVAINAREADGKDTSWLWDVAFDQITPRPVAAAGQRCADLGVRLSYADLPHHTDPDPLAALARLPAGPVDVLANYSAFHHLHRRLLKYHRNR
jgi:UDP-N-acetylmuramyl tripeptide synthase